MSLFSSRDNWTWQENQYQLEIHNLHLKIKKLEEELARLNAVLLKQYDIPEDFPKGYSGDDE